LGLEDLVHLEDLELREVEDLDYLVVLMNLVNL
jgi:hypothetical protein